jgi:uncharacterized membrane protein YtjA (UPF0391 family)
MAIKLTGTFQKARQKQVRAGDGQKPLGEWRNSPDCPAHLQAGNFGMLRRAGIWTVVAMVMVLYASSGLFKQTDGVATICGYVAAGFAVVSLLLSLFEEPSGSPELQGHADKSG